MDRRRFLTALFGTAVALPLLDRLEIPVRAALESLPPSAPECQQTFMATLMEAERLFYQKLTALDWLPKNQDSRVAMIGQTFDHAIVASRQFSVDSRGRMLIPQAMDSLATRCTAHGIDQYGRLQTHLPGVEFAGTGLLLRMIVAYDVSFGDSIVRFDVLGGTSPDGERRARWQWQQDLKTRIRRRLSKPTRILPLPA